VVEVFREGREADDDNALERHWPPASMLRMELGTGDQMPTHLFFNGVAGVGNFSRSVPSARENRKSRVF
jgi:hypothetical protein